MASLKMTGHYSFIALSVLFSGLLTAGIYRVGKEFFGKRAGIISAIVFLTSPYFWYYGLITIYALPIAFFGLMCAYYSYKTIKGQDYIIAASIFYALMIGVRPQELPSLLLIWLWAVWKSRSLKGVFIFALVCLFWFGPMVSQAGGLKGYCDWAFGEADLSLLWAWKSREFIKSNLTSKIRIMVYTFGIGLIPLIYGLYPFFNLKRWRLLEVRFLLLWICPALLLYTLVLFGNELIYISIPCLGLIIYFPMGLKYLIEDITKRRE